MAIEKVTAWRTTPGNCYENKGEAYHAEMVYLIQTRSPNNHGPANEKTFEDAVSQQQDLVDSLIEMKKGLIGQKDQKIKANVGELLRRAENWLNDAKKLQASIEDGE